MTIVLPHGVLFRGGEEGEIRRNLIEKNNIDAIIGLPANIFFGTGIPTIIMVLRQKRPNTDVLIIDASKHFEKVGKNNKLRASDIKRIVDTVVQRKTVDKFSRVVERDEIRRNDYNLNIPRYVDSSEQAESWDILAVMSGGIPNAEIDQLQQYWEAFPNLRDKLFCSAGESYSALAVEDVAAAVKESADAKAYIDNFTAHFSDFSGYLRDRLIDGLHSLEHSANEDEISSNIYARLATVPLVDYYEAYEILDHAWATISSDLETIHREGFAATKCVDPNMVLKKKGGTEEEVQEGWAGRILPFSLVQEQLMGGELAALKAHEERLMQIASGYEEALDNLSEEDKEADFVNEDGTGFVWPAVKKAIKAKEVEPEVLATLKSVLALNEEEKALKKQVKEENTQLHIKAKEIIGGLSDEQVLMLLEQKWIVPLVKQLYELPQAAVDGLAKKVSALAQKYAATLTGLDAEITQTEREFSAMLDQLTGSASDMAGLAELKKLLGGV